MLFGVPSIEESEDSNKNISLKIDVSSDDSSIKIKEDERKQVVYHIDWLDGK